MPKYKVKNTNLLHNGELKKIGDVTTQPDNSATCGKIKKISHLVEVEKA